MRKSWSVFLVLFVVAILGSSPALAAYELTLYSIPSPKKIDWSSPRGLAKCAIANNLTLKKRGGKRAIGHVFIELKGPDYYRVAGSSTAPENTMKEKVLKKGYGLGILFTGIEGRLEDTESLVKELPIRYKTGRIAFITFRLNKETFERLVTYITEYEKRGYSKIYNGLNRPREGLGAGCSAFGISFLEVAGLHHPVWKKNWPVRVRIPDELVGGPLTGNKVGLTRILRVKRWAKKKEPHKLLELYEPYYIYEWITRTFDKEKKKPTNTAGLMTRGKAKGLIYDCRHVACPTEPIFMKPTAELK